MNECNGTDDDIIALLTRATSKIKTKSKSGIRPKAKATEPATEPATVIENGNVKTKRKKQKQKSIYAPPQEFFSPISDSAVSTPYRVSPSPSEYNNCMHVFIDVRETDVYANCIEIFKTNNLTTEYIPCVESKPLLIGDIEVCDYTGTSVVLIERKTIADLVASIKDGRYTEQAYRLHHASSLHAHNIIYIIEGTLSSSKYNSSTLKMVKSAIISLQLFKGFSIIRTNNVSETAGYIMDLSVRLAHKFKEGQSLYFENPSLNKSPDVEQGGDIDVSLLSGSGIPSYSTVVKAIKKQNITYQNIHAIMLSQIPGISPDVAEIILDGNTMEEFIHRLRQGDRWLFQLKITLPRSKKSRALSKSVIKSIYLYLFNTPPPT